MPLPYLVLQPGTWTFFKTLAVFVTHFQKRNFNFSRHHGHLAWRDQNSFVFVSNFRKKFPQKNGFDTPYLFSLDLSFALPATTYNTSHTLTASTKASQSTATWSLFAYHLRQPTTHNTLTASTNALRLPASTVKNEHDSPQRTTPYNLLVATQENKGHPSTSKNCNSQQLSMK